DREQRDPWAEDAAEVEAERAARDEVAAMWNLRRGRCRDDLDARAVCHVDAEGPGPRVGCISGAPRRRVRRCQGAQGDAQDEASTGHGAAPSKVHADEMSKVRPTHRSPPRARSTVTVWPRRAPRSS